MTRSKVCCQNCVKVLAVLLSWEVAIDPRSAAVTLNIPRGPNLNRIMIVQNQITSKVIYAETFAF